MQDFVGHSNPAVGIDLDNVFTGEGLRRSHSSNHDLVENLVLIWIYDMTVVEGVASHAGQIFTFEDLLRNGKAVCSAQADDSDRPLTERSRDGSDGIKFFSNHVISLFL